MNRLLVLLAFAAFTAQIKFTVGISETVEYYYKVNLAPGGVEAQYGLITTLTLKFGRFCHKGSTVLDPIIWNAQELAERETVPRAVWFTVERLDDHGRLSINPVQQAKTLQLAWVSREGNYNGLIEVDSVIFIRVKHDDSPTASTLMPFDMIQESKAFCGAGELISNTNPGTLKQCTAKKMNEIRLMAAHLWKSSG